MERASQMDGKGALFSWMSINGEETNASFECATAQYHINAAVSYGIYQYVKNTMDKEFLYQFGAEILFETALFYIDRGRFINDRDNRFCLNMVCGPDEYGCVVNNNAYTNRMTKFHFEYTVEAYHEMEKECPTVLASLCEKTGLTTAHINAFMKAAECMFENYLPERGIHAQDDSYLYKDPVDMTKTPRNVDIRHGLHPLNAWRIQATKQADVVLMMFVMGQDYSLEVKRANYEFYEPKTVHSSSLSAGIHSIVANEINKTEDAYEYFQQSLYMDLKNLRRNTEAGVHFACLGSTWMAVVNGYAGLRDYPKGIYLYPNLPDTWTEYKMKLNIRGRQIELRVGVDQVMITLLQGDDLNIIVYDKSIKFSEAQPIHIIQRN